MWIIKNNMIKKYCLLLVALASFSLISAQIFDQRPAVAAANHFLSSLSEGQKKITLRSMADTNRTRWSNLPLEQAVRDGIRLDDLNDEQRMNIHALLRTVLSDQGYLKALSIMQYDQDTHDKLTTMNSPIAHRYGQEKFWTWIFGHPSLEEKWGFKFEGHHLSINMNFSPQGVSCTPHFTGINPGLISKGITAGKYIMYRENEIGKKLFNSLNDRQQKKALIDSLPSNIDARAQTGNETFLHDRKGLPFKEMNKDQKAMIWDMLSAWIDNFNLAIADNKRKQMRKLLPQSRFVWMGTNSINDLHYYGVITPDWSIEFTNRDQGIQHFHTLWRLIPDDFGKKL